MDAFPSSGQQGLPEEGWAQGLRPCSQQKESHQQVQREDAQMELGREDARV